MQLCLALPVQMHLCMLEGVCGKGVTVGRESGLLAHWQVSTRVHCMFVCLRLQCDCAPS